MFCPKCGSLINDTAVFCPKCGLRVSDEPTNSTETTNTGSGINSSSVEKNNLKQKASDNKKNGKALKIGLMSVATLAAVGLVIGLAINSNSSSPAAPPAAPAAPAAEPATTTSQDEEVASEREAESDTKDYTPNPTAENELLGYVDQADKLVTDSYDTLFPMSADFAKKAGSYKELAELLRSDVEEINTVVTELQDLKEKAAAITGLDNNLSLAQDWYFTMMLDSAAHNAEILSFGADEFELYGTSFQRPKYTSGDYKNISAYAVDLNEWSKNAKSIYDSIENPPCTDYEWAEIGDMIDLNSYIAEKAYLADSITDNLRFGSSVLLSDRADAVWKQSSSRTTTLLGREQSFTGVMIDKSRGLKEQMHEYSQLGQSEREAYEFNDPSFIGKFEVVDTIYPSLYDTYDAICVDLTGSFYGSKKIVIECEIPGFTQRYKEAFTLTDYPDTIFIKPPLLTGVLDLSSAKDAQINVAVTDDNGKELYTHSFPVTIKSKYDFEWYSDDYGSATQDNIICYLTPEAEGITQLKRKAIDEISTMTNGDMESFPGYQESGYDNYVTTYLQAAGLMRALYDMGVRYNMDAFSISGSNQHILYPNDVIEQKSGLCIETSLVVASALKSANMHAFLLFPPGHAQVAVETWDGSGEYFLIETTALEQSSNNDSIYIDYANKMIKGGLESVAGDNSCPICYYNQEQWREMLASGEIEYLIDCDDVSVLGITPFSN